MEQLPLEIRCADHAVFDNFLPVGNELLVHELREAATTGGQPMLWLWGTPASGKSHLLQACVAAADHAGRRSAYVPLGPAAGLPVGVLEGLGALDLVCLDDVDAITGRRTEQPDWEAGIFRLFEELRQDGGRLVVAASGPPADVAFELPDLASRLKSGATFRIQSLDDSGRLQALQIRARFRGFELPVDTGHYLLTRVDRGADGLFRLLDQLDRAALAAQKRLTIPFVRKVLGS